jgi:hypothetical protein
MKEWFRRYRARGIEIWLWGAFVFALPFQTMWLIREVFVLDEKWQYASFGVYVSDILLVVLAISLFRKYVLLGAFDTKNLCRFFRQDKPRAIAIGSFFLLVLWSFLSALWAKDVMMAISFSTTLFLGWIACVVAISGVVPRKMAVVAFVVALVIHSGIGIFQFLAQYSPPITMLGMAQHDPSQAGVSVIKTDNTRWLRSYGGLQHPNIFGGALAVAMVLIVSVFVVNRSKSDKETSDETWLLALGIVCAFAMVLTFSRMAWLGVALGLAVLVITSIVAGGEITRRWWTVISVLAISVMICAWIVREPLFSRFSTEAILADGSVSERHIFIEQAKALIAEHPIVGVGAGNFTAETSARYWESDSYIALFQPVHNVPLLLWSELGFVGCIFVTIIVIAVMWRVILSRRYEYFAVFCALLPAIILDHWLFSSHFGILMVSVLAGLAMTSDVGRELRDSKKRRNLRI